MYNAYYEEDEVMYKEIDATDSREMEKALKLVDLSNAVRTIRIIDSVEHVCYGILIGLGLGLMIKCRKK